MSNSKRAHFNRISRHVTKKLRTTVNGLRPSGIRGRFIGPRVLLNSIPKAGTHLLETALEHFSLLRNAGRRTVACWGMPSPKTITAIRSISKGQFLNAHLTAQPVVFDIVSQNNIKVLFMIRDPRDIVVSHYKYVCSIDKIHRAHKHYMDLEHDDARLLASIVGVQGLKPSIGEILRKFEPWLEAKNTLVCRFEDLIGSSGGGSQELQLITLASIADHLGIPISDEELENIANRTYSSKSSTFRQGKTGDWKEYFKPEHVSTFKNVADRELILYGYENNSDW